MPTSTYAHIATVARYLEHVMPRSVLDIGIGNGKMGFIARDLLDVMLGGRYHRRDWQVRLDGIEAFADYVQAHQRALYDELYIGDAFTVIDTLGAYDLAIVGDVLEHFEPTRACEFMDKCARRATWIILNIPLGAAWTQEDIYGNDFERHRSFWTRGDFERAATLAEYFTLAPGEYGAFLIASTDWMHARIWRDAAGLDSDAERIAMLGPRLAALPPRAMSELRFAELLVSSGRCADAYARLRLVRDTLDDATAVDPAIAQLAAFLP